MAVVNHLPKVLPKLGLEVSQKRITPPSGSTLETPTKCHSLRSPASRASWICSVVFSRWFGISSWAKNRSCCCSVTRRPSLTNLLKILTRFSAPVVWSRRPEHEHDPSPERQPREKLFVQDHHQRPPRDVAIMQSPPAFGTFRRDPEPLSQPHARQEYYGYRQFVVTHHNLPRL
jgi:hypothetical protein